jgi:hypothetical protein
MIHLFKNVTVSPVHSALIDSSLIAISLFHHTFLLFEPFLNRAFIIIVISDAFEILLTIGLLQPDLLLLLSFILNLTTAILFYWISLLLKQTICNLFLLLLLVLSPKLPNFITFVSFLNIFTGSKFMREFNTKFSLTYKTLLWSSFIIFILFLVLNSLVLHAHFVWSLLIVHLIILASKLLLLSGTIFLLINSPLFSLSPSVILKILKTHLFHFCFLP